MRPSEAEFKEWLGHPVTEWVLGLVEKFAKQQRDRWAKLAWDSGEISPEAFAEARVRADSYLALSQSSYSDWEGIDDSEA